MVGSSGTCFSTRVLHFAASLRGTRPYWMRQRSRLIAMVDTLGLPTVFFTHSAADLQWPELAHLICPDHPDDRSARSHAVIENPAIADWSFCERVPQFLKHFYNNILGAKDYWLPNAPDMEQLLPTLLLLKLTVSTLFASLTVWFPPPTLLFSLMVVT